MRERLYDGAWLALDKMINGAIRNRANKTTTSNVIGKATGDDLAEQRSCCFVKAAVPTFNATAKAFVNNFVIVFLEQSRSQPHRVVKD